MIAKKIKDEEIEVKKILKDCAKFGKTIGIDVPTAIERYIGARKGEISREKEKVRKAKLKIKKIEAVKILAEKALTDFWIKETDKRKVK